MPKLQVASSDLFSTEAEVDREVDGEAAAASLKNLKQAIESNEDLQQKEEQQLPVELQD